jgi:hypothetical protein
MDTTTLLISFVFGMVGMGMFMYGKKAGRPVPLAAGAALMILPCVIPNAIALAAVCSAITVTPWFLRNA